MSSHPSLAAGSSQCACILAELQQQPCEWVSLVRLHAVSGSMAVHSRINDLRQRGHRIEHRNQRVKKMIHSFDRLVPASSSSNQKSTINNPQSSIES